MQKIITTLIIFIVISNFCFADEKENKILPQSKIGGMVGMQWGGYIFDWVGSVECSEDCTKWKTPQGIGVNIFYHLYLLSNGFVSVNVGYNIYKTQTQEIKSYFNDVISIVKLEQKDNLVATIGVNWCIYSDKIYIGMAGGILNRTTNNWTSIQPEFCLVGGFSIPIAKYNVSIEANAKRFINNSGINLGIAYLFPRKNS